MKTKKSIEVPIEKKEPQFVKVIVKDNAKTDVVKYKGTRITKLKQVEVSADIVKIQRFKPFLQII